MLQFWNYSLSMSVVLFFHEKQYNNDTFYTPLSAQSPLSKLL